MTRTIDLEDLVFFWKNNKAQLNLQNLEANLQILLILLFFELRS